LANNYLDNSNDDGLSSLDNKDNGILPQLENEDFKLSSKSESRTISAEPINSVYFSRRSR